MLPIQDENVSETVPYVNNCLIAINIIVLCLQVYLFGAAVLVGVTDNSYCMVPSRFLHNFDAAEALTLLTAMFSHAGLGHLIGNLWVLYLFGDNVEDKIGHRNYLIFYLGCGVMAAMAHIISDPTSTVPCLGASGAIAGVMAAYLVLFPNVPVKTWICWFWCINIPAWIIIGGWFGLQLLATATFDSADHVAYFAHIGGFAAGIAFIQMFSIRKSQFFAHAEDAIDIGHGNQFKLPPQGERGLSSAIVTCLILAGAGYGIREYTMQSRHQTAIAQSRPTQKPIKQPTTSTTHHHVTSTQQNSNHTQNSHPKTSHPKNGQTQNSQTENTQTQNAQTKHVH